jgi:hypothetical protein
MVLAPSCGSRVPTISLKASIIIEPATTTVRSSSVAAGSPSRTAIRSPSSSSRAGASLRTMPSASGKHLLLDPAAQHQAIDVRQVIVKDDHARLSRQAACASILVQRG